MPACLREYGYRPDGVGGVGGPGAPEAADAALVRLMAHTRFCLPALHGSTQVATLAAIAELLERGLYAEARARTRRASRASRTRGERGSGRTNVRSTANGRGTRDRSTNERGATKTRDGDARPPSHPPRTSQRGARPRAKTEPPERPPRTEPKEHARVVVTCHSAPRDSSAPRATFSALKHVLPWVFHAVQEQLARLLPAPVQARLLAALDALSSRASDVGVLAAKVQPHIAALLAAPPPQRLGGYAAVVAGGVGVGGHWDAGR